MPRSTDDKQSFSLRLKQALKRSSKNVKTPAELALQFNLRHPNESVSPQATQKWLSGLSRPTPDKIDTLAEWLNVSAQWLRYGIPEERPASSLARKEAQRKMPAVVQPTEDELKLLASIRSLPEHRRNLVTEIVAEFALESEMWRN